MTARLAVASEVRVRRCPDGTVVAPPPLGHDHWRTLFGPPMPVTLVVRAEDGAAGEGGVAVGGPDVDVVTLPPLRPGPGLVADVPRALRRLWRLGRGTFFVLRMPGIVPSLALAVALCRRSRFAVQVVGDPVDVTFGAGVGGRLAPVAGGLMWLATRVACRRADVVAYVTDAYLQRRYPPGPRSRAHAVSDVRLPEAAPDTAGRRRRPAGALAEPIRLVTVGSLETPYKRVDLLVDVVARLRQEGWPVRLAVVGDGRERDGLERRARARGAVEHVEFLGTLDAADLAALLARSDLFVLCSDTEGMPRALLEAMAAGLPCVATAVGGVPEVLPAEALCRPGSADSLHAAVRRHLVSGRLRRHNADRGLATAERFRPGALDRRRTPFVADLERAARG